MSGKLVQVECCFCGHTWIVDLKRLDEARQVVFKGEGEKEYRAKCPNCGTNNVFPVPVAEGEVG